MPLKLHEGSQLSAFSEFIFNVTHLSTLRLYPQIPPGLSSVEESQRRPPRPRLQEVTCCRGVAGCSSCSIIKPKGVVAYSPEHLLVHIVSLGFMIIFAYYAVIF